MGIIAQVKVIRTKAELNAAVARIAALSASTRTPAEDDELALLRILVEHCDERAMAREFRSAADVLRHYMRQLKLAPKDLVAYLGSASRVSEVMHGRRTLSLDMVRKLHRGLGIPYSLLLLDPAADHPIQSDPTRRRVKPPTRPLFGYAGTKLVFALLTDPALDADPGGSLLNSTYKTISAAAGISPASVSTLFTEMKERGFLVEDSRSRLLVERRPLVERWLHGYLQWRERRNAVHLQTADTDWWRSVDWEDVPIRLGGETAACLMTDGFLHPEVVTLYSDELLYDFTVEYGLQRVDDGGNVLLLAPLPGRPWRDRRDCVHPLLVYADLQTTRSDRNREAAERIYADFLRPIIDTA